MFVELCNGDLLYVCQFVYVSCTAVPTKVLPNVKSRVEMLIVLRFALSSDICMVNT